ncbi:uncharacterized protein LOC129249885 [Anastrepha obliqua]|uniref:uncharacterized protein LOC129249885 n=1 Tax=Anastrepha obliqua TaxID=95512 RepID=UPI002409BEA2|nr:uncharacterized protein LOC129249885 [Anastrepha obliqua]
MRELRLLKNPKKSGSGVNDVYETKLWCFDQLSFLEGHVATRQRQYNTEMPSSSSSSSTYTNTENSNFMSTESNSSSVNDEPSKIRKKFGQMQREFSLFKTMIQKKKNSRKSAWLGALVANQMEEIDHDEQQSAAWETQSVIKRYVDESNHGTLASLTTSSSSDKDLLQLSMDGVLYQDDFC